MDKKALLVGINDYQRIGDLNGCINDITNVRSILKTYLGFENRNIRVLVDRRASKKNIIFRLEKMVKQAKSGDFLFFHFSGHGSQIRDRNNDELEDHMDELICPYDMNWDDGFITDDILYGIFKELKPDIFLEVVLDCCHSGTGLRDIELPRPDEHTSMTLSRFLPPPMDILCRYEGEDNRLSPTHSFTGADWRESNKILWAGCRSDQTSADAYINGSYNGAFSYYFCKHLRDSQGKISRDELHTRIQASLTHNKYFQTPQLECTDFQRVKPVFTTSTK